MGQILDIIEKEAFKDFSTLKSVWSRRGENSSMQVFRNDECRATKQARCVGHRPSWGWCFRYDPHS